MSVPLLETRGLTLFTGVASPDVTLLAGQRRAFLGPEGWGKSLLLNTLAGLTPPRAGTILLDGRPLSQWNATERADRIGVAFQETPRQWLMPTVWEEVALGPARQGLEEPERTARVETALEWTGVPPSLRQAPLAPLPPSLRGRVVYAALLAARPRLILTDEPGAFLSDRGEDELARCLTHYCQTEGAALLLVTSRLDRARRFADEAPPWPLPPAAAPFERFHP